MRTTSTLALLAALMASPVWANTERNKIQDKKYYENCQVYTTSKVLGSPSWTTQTILCGKRGDGAIALIQSEKNLGLLLNLESDLPTPEHHTEVSASIKFYKGSQFKFTLSWSNEISRITWLNPLEGRLIADLLYNMAKSNHIGINIGCQLFFVDLTGSSAAMQDFQSRAGIYLPSQHERN